MCFFPLFILKWPFFNEFLNFKGGVGLFLGNSSNVFEISWFLKLGYWEVWWPTMAWCPRASTATTDTSAKVSMNSWHPNTCQDCIKLTYMNLNPYWRQCVEIHLDIILLDKSQMMGDAIDFCNRLSLDLWPPVENYRSILVINIKWSSWGP